MVATNNLKYILNNDRKNLCTRNDEPWSSNTMVSGYFGDDGTLYVSTTSAIAANSNLYFADSFILQAGVEYKFGLCPGSGPVRLALVNANGEWVANQFGTTPSTYTPSATGTFSMYVYIYSGTNVTNHPITPMICPTAVWDYDSTYVQPARTNAELTVLEASDRAGLVDVVDSGAKNLLNLETCTISSTHSAITFTVSGNTITVSSTGASDVQEVQIKNLSLPVNVDLALSGCPAGGSESTYLVDAFNNGGYIQGQTGDTGNGEIIKFTTMTNSRIRIRVAANATFTNKVFNLMVCTKAAFGVSSKFVPYRPNWDLVVESIKTIPCMNVVETGTGGNKFSFVIKKLKTTQARYPMRVTIGTQRDLDSPVMLSFNVILSALELSKTGIALYKYLVTSTSIPAVWFKSDSTNGLIYVTVEMMSSTSMWGSAYIEYYPADSEMIITTSGAIDISSDSSATRMDIYAPTMNLLS